MYFLYDAISQLKRPPLLVKAAQYGSARYRRKTHMPRLLSYGPDSSAGTPLSRLMAIEHELNTQRKTHAAYNISRHIEVLSALLAEFQMNEIS